MRAAVIALAFLLAFGGAVYYLLDRQGYLGADGVRLLWSMPAAPPPAPERVDPTPLAAMLRDELAEVERAKGELERERRQFQAELEELERQRDAMANELEAVRLHRETMARKQAENVQSLSRILSNMDAAAAAEILDKLPEDMAVGVLLATKQRESGAMLEEMNPDKAAVLSERILQATSSAS